MANREAVEGSWGIEPVPPRLRVLGGVETGLLWGNLGVSLLVVVAGAILVPALVMGALMTGALFYVAAVGDAIIFRTELQNAADVTSFKSAVWHARGMNTITSLNQFMVAALAMFWMVIPALVAIAVIVGVVTTNPRVQPAA